MVFWLSNAGRHCGQLLETSAIHIESNKWCNDCVLQLCVWFLFDGCRRAIFCQLTKCESKWQQLLTTHQNKSKTISMCYVNTKHICSEYVYWCTRYRKKQNKKKNWEREHREKEIVWFKFCYCVWMMLAVTTRPSLAQQINTSSRSTLAEAQSLVPWLQIHKE